MTTSDSVVSSVKAKLDAMMNQGKGQKSLVWRPTRGKEEQVRIIPYKHGPDPFNELHFHYDIGPVKTILCPTTVGIQESCPVCEYAKFLYSKERSDENYALFKRLKKKTRTYVPVIVRGDEAAGVRFWGIGTTTYKQIAKLFVAADYGDISDPLKGRDIRVLATQPNSQYIYGQVDVQPAGNSSPLTANIAEAKQWITECPNVFEAFTKMTTEEIQSALDSLIEQGDSPATNASTTDEEDEVAASDVPGVIDLEQLYKDLKK